ncbi:hypothetical protein EUGRSUZ_A01844 [Eucalyptus grandis]|uniref:Uncharacterized protein n=2 Tax=Eucalyptus grandis TaxID=71139 RepID=A0A059DH69_EUCGR|nr:hypothetical protein EUGRSUZ_A01844 [Eucalyptus grandis]
MWWVLNGNLETFHHHQLGVFSFKTEGFLLQGTSPFILTLSCLRIDSLRRRPFCFSAGLILGSVLSKLLLISFFICRAPPSSKVSSSPPTQNFFFNESSC